MRTKRIKVLGRESIYHCMSRTVNGAALFGDREKEMLRKMIWQIAEFSGVQVLTYCVMNNHFHVLVRVPLPENISDGELIRRFSVLYPTTSRFQPLTAKDVRRILESGGEAADRLRAQLLARMTDVSQYMKTLKQRFATWFNQSHDRFGCLWAERFKSVLVQGHGNPLQTIAAYIDLNAVRAGLVDDPKDYRFCGYAEAVAGESSALNGIKFVWFDYFGSALDQPPLKGRGDCVLEAHRMLLFGKGACAKKARQYSVNREKALQILESSNGRLSRTEMLRCRVRYFTDGKILGTAEFVREAMRGMNLGSQNRRTKAPVQVKGAEWGDLSVSNPLRSGVFS